jgi:ankyrin repeat protein
MREVHGQNPDVLHTPIVDTYGESTENNQTKLIIGSVTSNQSGSLESGPHQVERNLPGGDIKGFHGSVLEAPVVLETPQGEGDSSVGALGRGIRSVACPSNSLERGAIDIPITRSSKLQMTRLEGMFCMKKCKCSCHCRLSRQLQLVSGHFGSLLISRTGRPFNPENCNEASCIKRCTPSLLIVFYIRLWFTLAVISLAFSNVGRLHITMSFPTVVPPGSDFFACIRAGQCERIRLLLATGAASVASIVAPYGLTPLALAVIYGQEDVSRLLIQAGAQLVAPNYTWVKSDVSNFFTGFSLLNSSITAGMVLQDYMRFGSPEAERKVMKSCVADLGSQSEPYTRLHKCILGITSESVDIVARQSRLSINETDSIGRTALHWATYMGDANIINTLLRCGADPDVFDKSSTTPLHAAAGLGSMPCVTALIYSGADLESRNRFGATPLHYAFQQGHMDVIEALIKEGASCEAENYFGETPISYAFYGEKINVISGSLHRDSLFDYVDEWGYTPILDAVLLDCHRVLELLLQLDNTNFNAKLVDNKTILHVAALNADLETIEILQNARLIGLDTAAVDLAGFTAMDYVRQRRDAADLIEPFGALLLSVQAQY